jgi:hypothetical protein
VQHKLLVLVLLVVRLHLLHQQLRCSCLCGFLLLQDLLHCTCRLHLQLCWQVWQHELRLQL